MTTKDEARQAKEKLLAEKPVEGMSVGLTKQQGLICLCVNVPNKKDLKKIPQELDGVSIVTRVLKNVRKQE